MKKRMKKVLCFALSLAMIMVCFTNIAPAGAKKKDTTKAKVSSVEFTNASKSLRLQKGKTFRLNTSVTVKPNKSKYKKLKFTSSNRKIVLVNSRGLLKGKKVGSAKITAASKTNTKKKATISVKVTNDILVKKIVLDKSRIEADEFNENDIELKVTKILPSNAKNKDINWSSSNEDVADVSDDGVVTTGDVGETVITASADDNGGATATCKVIVNKNTDKDDDDADPTDEPDDATTAPAPIVTTAPAPVVTDAPAPVISEEPVVTEAPVIDIKNLTISAKTDYLAPGETTTMNLAYTPSDTTKTGVFWTTDNDDVTISSKGDVSVSPDFTFDKDETEKLVVVTATSKEVSSLTKSVIITIFNPETTTIPTLSNPNLDLSENMMTTWVKKGLYGSYSYDKDNHPVFCSTPASEDGFHDVYNNGIAWYLDSSKGRTDISGYKYVALTIDSDTSVGDVKMMTWGSSDSADFFWDKKDTWGNTVDIISNEDGTNTLIYRTNDIFQNLTYAKAIGLTIASYDENSGSDNRIYSPRTATIYNIDFTNFLPDGVVDEGNEKTSSPLENTKLSMTGDNATSWTDRNEFGTTSYNKDGSVSFNTTPDSAYDTPYGYNTGCAWYVNTDRSSADVSDYKYITIKAKSTVAPSILSWSAGSEPDGYYNKKAIFSPSSSVINADGSSTYVYSVKSVFTNTERANALGVMLIATTSDDDETYKEQSATIYDIDFTNTLPTGGTTPTAAPTKAPIVTAAPTVAPIVTATPTTVPSMAPIVTAAPTTVPSIAPIVTVAPTTVPSMAPIVTATPTTAAPTSLPATAAPASSPAVTAFPTNSEVTDYSIDLTGVTTTFTNSPAVINFSDQLPSNFVLTYYDNAEINYTLDWESEDAKEDFQSIKFAFAKSASLDGYKDGLINTYSSGADTTTATIDLTTYTSTIIPDGVNIQPMDTSCGWPTGLNSITITGITFHAKEGAEYLDEIPAPTYAQVTPNVSTDMPSWATSGSYGTVTQNLDGTISLNTQPSLATASGSVYNNGCSFYLDSANHGQTDVSSYKYLAFTIQTNTSVKLMTWSDDADPDSFWNKNDYWAWDSTTLNDDGSTTYYYLVSDIFNNPAAASAVGVTLKSCDSEDTSTFVAQQAVISDIQFTNTKELSVADISKDTVIKNYFNDSTADWFARSSGNASIELSNEAVEGKSLLVTGRTSSWNGCALDLSEWMKAGGTYHVTFQAKMPESYTADSSITLTGSGAYKPESDSSEKYINYSPNTITNDSWTTYSFDISAPEALASYIFYLETSSAPTAEFLIDNFQITCTALPAKCDTTLTSIKSAYAPYIGNMGVAVSYEQLLNTDTLEFINHHFNSITMGNEMKPDALMEAKTSKTLESIEDTAESEDTEYIVNDDYKNCTANQDADGKVIVPTIDFTKVDKIMEIAYNNNLKVRFHTLIWHQQMPHHFFTEGYSDNANAAYVDEATMYSREEMYIRTVMNHILSSDYSSVVYTVDVANEYTHMDTSSANYWTNIFGTTMTTNCEYIKKAYVWAYDELAANDRTDISLMYNDYNTYEGTTTTQIIDLINYINTTDELNTVGKICNGVGMQSHLDVAYPSATVFENALEAFAAENFEIQITELDITTTVTQCTTQAEIDAALQTQADQYGAIMSAVLEQKNAGANITGVTVWGLTDSSSWRSSKAPLLFGENIGDKKCAFDSFVNAALDFE